MKMLVFIKNKLSFHVNFVNILNIWKFYSVYGCVSGLYVFRMFWGIIMIYICKLVISYITYLIGRLFVHK